MEECHLPGLGVALTLDHTKNESSDDGVSDLVCFVSGLLLGTNAKVRTWFGTFIRNGQQVRQSLNKLLLNNRSCCKSSVCGHPCLSECTSGLPFTSSLLVRDPQVCNHCH